MNTVYNIENITLKKCCTIIMLFDDNMIKMARKPGMKQKENPVGCIGEGKRWKGNIREGSKE